MLDHFQPRDIIFTLQYRHSSSTILYYYITPPYTGTFQVPLYIDIRHNIVFCIWQCLILTYDAILYFVFGNVLYWHMTQYCILYLAMCYIDIWHNIVFVFGNVLYWCTTQYCILYLTMCYIITIFQIMFYLTFVFMSGCHFTVTFVVCHFTVTFSELVLHMSKTTTGIKAALWHIHCDIICHWYVNKYISIMIINLCHFCLYSYYRIFIHFDHIFIHRSTSPHRPNQRQCLAFWFHTHTG